MEMNEIYELMDKFDASKSSYIKLEMNDVKLILKKPDMTSTQMPQILPFAYGQQPASNIAGMQSTDALNDNQANNQANNQTNNQTAGEDTKQAVNEDDYIKAPLVGVFYAAASPDKPAYVSVGSRVNKGDVVCLIEAMKMMNEVVAHKSGVIKEVLVENEDMVEYDTPLFIIQE